MTAPARSLRAAPEPAAGDAVVDRWGPECQYLGALLWLPGAQARPLLALVPDRALGSPLPRWAHELIRRTVHAGADPNPVLVLDAARRHPPSDSLRPDRPPEAAALARLALYLFDAYSHVIAPAHTAATYAAQVLDRAYRQAFADCGAHMQQIATTATGRDDLAGHLTAIRDELADLLRRAEQAAALSDRNRPPLA